MAKKEKPESVLTPAELKAAVLEALAMERDIESRKEVLDGLRESIKETMLANRIAEYRPDPERNEGAKIVKQETYSWDVLALKKTLDDKEFDKFCPPTPRAKELRALAEGTRPELKYCARRNARANLVLEQPLVKTVETLSDKAKKRKRA